MTAAPHFTVLLPAKGRPGLVRDALVSVLEQSFGDFEVIVSNNGAEAAVRDAIADRMGDPRIRYVEHPIVRPMPEHWEAISRLALGHYLTVLPDRSLLKQGALTKIAELHKRGGCDAQIVTWSWDLYFATSGLVQPFAGRATNPVVLDSDMVALGSLSMGAPFPAALPRGLNSSVSHHLVDEIRDNVGAAFAPISPDFSFAYACLLSRSRLTHLDQALTISQGLNVSNGGKAYLADASAYVSSLGLSEPIRYSPIKALFVENIIAEDFFSACHQFGRLDLLTRTDRVDLYLKCLAELDEKRVAGQLPPKRIQELANAIEEASAREPHEVQSRIQTSRQTPMSLERLCRFAVKRLLGKRVELLRPLLTRMRGGKRFDSALQAAGHFAR